jgi:UDP-N-acetylglucosamine--N-acetylmuramyl-(pentapeptide) pyrophosphoryl-undecaprenol N-acetylglucosamine transferase
MALVHREAALYVRDAEAQQKLLPLAIDTVNDDGKLKSLSSNILKMALPDSADIIAKEVIKLAEQVH